MKKLLLLIAAIGFTAISNAQTLDEIIAKNLIARGGVDKIKGLKSVVMESTNNMQGQEVPIKLTLAQDKGIKMEMTLMGMDNYMMVNKKEGYNYFPIGGQKSPEPMPAEQVSGMQEAFDLHGEFINTKEKGIKLELQGEEDVDGTQCYKILCVRPDKTEKRIYIDKELNQIIKEVSKVTINGKEMEQASEYSNFKMVDGVVFAHEVGGPMGKMKVNKIIVNSDIPESFFAVKN